MVYISNMSGSKTNEIVIGLLIALLMGIGVLIFLHFGGLL